MKDEHLKKYQETIDSFLNIKEVYSILCRNLECTDKGHLKDINTLSNELVQICLHAADKSIPCAGNDKKER